MFISAMSYAGLIDGVKHLMAPKVSEIQKKLTRMNCNKVNFQFYFDFSDGNVLLEKKSLKTYGEEHAKKRQTLHDTDHAVAGQSRVNPYLLAYHSIIREMSIQFEPENIDFLAFQLESAKKEVTDLDKYAPADFSDWEEVGSYIYKKVRDEVVASHDFGSDLNFIPVLEHAKKRAFEVGDALNVAIILTQGSLDAGRFKEMETWLKNHKEYPCHFVFIQVGEKEKSQVHKLDGIGNNVQTFKLEVFGHWKNGVLEEWDAEKFVGKTLQETPDFWSHNFYDKTKGKLLPWLKFRDEVATYRGEKLREHGLL